MKLCCKHCGIRYRASRDVGGFCCRGCAQVYDLIQAEGLDGFYGEAGALPRPVGDRPFEARDFRWTVDAQRTAEQVSDGATARVLLRITGMSCVGCVWLVERLVMRAGGVRAAQASLTGQLLRVEWAGADFDLVGLVEALHRFGYDVWPRDASLVRLNAMDWRLLLSGVFAVNAGLLSAAARMEEWTGLFELLQLLFAALSLLVGGSALCVPLYRGWQMRRFPMDGLAGVVLVLGSGYACWLGSIWSVSVLVACLLFPEWVGWRLGVVERWRRWPLYLSGLLVLFVGLFAGQVLGAASVLIGYTLSGLLLAWVYCLVHGYGDAALD